MCAIAPGSFLTPLTSSRFRSESLLEDILFPRRLGNPDEYASLVEAIVRNPYMNAEVIRLDAGAWLTSQWDRDPCSNRRTVLNRVERKNKWENSMAR